MHAQTGGNMQPRQRAVVLVPASKYYQDEEQITEEKKHNSERELRLRDF